VGCVVEYPRFSDFAEESKAFDGDKKKIDEILNKEILVIDFKLKESKHHRDTQYLTLQFKIGDTTFIMFNGSSVLADQLEKYKDNLPFYAVIKKIDKYYTFS
jgi:capsule polysaccharide modification protein KpsS